jgi:hypothetical protein
MFLERQFLKKIVDFCTQKLTEVFPKKLPLFSKRCIRKKIVYKPTKFIFGKLIDYLFPVSMERHRVPETLIQDTLTDVSYITKNVTFVPFKEGIFCMENAIYV